MDRSNCQKQKEVYNLAHVWATTLVTTERSKPEGNRRTTMQLIKQVIAEFQLRGLRVSLSKTTINKYVARGSIGQFPIARGYCGMIPPHVFCLLVLAIESKIQIDQVNSGSLEQSEIIQAINKCCGVAAAEGGHPKATLFKRVMWATNVKLNVTISPPVEE